MTRRTETEIAADTVMALMLDGILRPHHQLAAMAAAGIHHDDLVAARARHKQRGFRGPDVEGAPPAA